MRRASDLLDNELRLSICRLSNIRARKLDHGDLWKRTINFLECYDPRQLKFVQDHFKTLVEEVLQFVNQIGKVGIWERIQDPYPI